MLGHLRNSWAPRAFIVSFKLETDEAILDDKASASLKSYGQDMVICNLLSSYREKVMLKFSDGKEVQVANQGGHLIEEFFVPIVIQSHDEKSKK